ncbi:MAG: hypothetical protein U0R49_04630 [Fimbriimonadales bacterium]
MSLFLSLADEEDRDTDRRGSPLLNLRTAALMVVVLLGGLTLVLALVMPGCMERKGWYITKSNLKSLSAAFQTYAQSNDSGFPPAFETREDGVALSNGRPLTWATQIAEYVQPDSLKNPRNKDEWDTLVGYPGRQEPANLSYGANGAILFSGLRTYDLQNSNNLVLLAETIGGGQMNSHDPLPLDVPEKRDGFLIGFDDSNGPPTNKSQTVTRLAFFNARSKDAAPLHSAHGVAAISPEGGLIVLSAGDQQLANARTRWVPKR